MKILVINSGSSSIKSKLIDSNTQEVIYSQNFQEIKNHEQCLKSLFLKIDLDDVDAFAHRVVHGADQFYKSIIIDDEVLRQLDSIEYLAPLHNPANTKAIKILKNMFPSKPQIAVFDTAFHHTMEPKAYMYALPYSLYKEHNIRKYGFHGSSHAYLTQKASELLNKSISQTTIISLHLGNGCSACAIKNGKSIDTTMGFTPLEGLMMGTRSGDIDPLIILFLEDKLNMDTQTINNLLNKQSGLKGISNYSSMKDVVELMKKGDIMATLAFEMFIYKIVKTIGSYWMILKNLDAIVFSGGIGEYSFTVRKAIIENISKLMQINFNINANNQNRVTISNSNSKVKLFVIPTDEELYIANEAKSLLT